MAKNDDFFNMYKRLFKKIDDALDNKNATYIHDNQINETVVGGAGIVAGSAIGFGGLVAGGTTGLSAAGITSGLASAGALVGGGMAAGIAVLAAPAVILGVGGVAIASKINKNKIKNQNLLLLKECLVKLRALYNEVESTSRKNQERISLLMQLISQLKGFIDELDGKIDNKDFDKKNLTILDETPKPKEEDNNEEEKDNKEGNNNKDE